MGGDPRLYAQEAGTGSEGSKPLVDLCHGRVGCSPARALGKTVEHGLLSYLARGARKLGLSYLDSSLSLMML